MKISLIILSERLAGFEYVLTFCKILP